VIGQPLDIGAGRQDDLVVEYILLVCPAIKGMQKSFADVGVCKKVGWNSAAVQLAAADIRIAAGIYLAAEKGRGR